MSTSGPECVKTSRQNRSARFYVKSEIYQHISRCGFCVEARFPVWFWVTVALKNVFTQPGPFPAYCKGQQLAEILTYVRHEGILVVAHLFRTIRSGARSFTPLVVMLMGVARFLTTLFAARMFVLRAGIQAELRRCHGRDWAEMWFAPNSHGKPNT